MKFQKKLKPRKAKFRIREKYSQPLRLPVPRAMRRNFHTAFSIGKSTRESLVKGYAPANLKFILTNEKSPFCLNGLKKDKATRTNRGSITIPSSFSIFENPSESIRTIKQIIKALFIERNQSLIFDYSKCSHVDLGTQAIMDIILKEHDEFTSRIKKSNKLKQLDEYPKEISGININNDTIQKMIFSIGSPDVLGIQHTYFPDVIKNALCSYNAVEGIAAMKDIHTTKMVDYVVKCLERMNKRLTPTKRYDLGVVIGETLINAEEHSTLHHRFSVGYFQERNEQNHHYGLLKLAIINFGSTIYETFKDNKSCPAATVEAMVNLSQKYTSRKLFKANEFEEESLWTLYALQQGVSSINQTRGNGTIQFIRSFFSIKGSKEADNVSKMIIYSGKTQIIFDGTYNITRDRTDRHYMMTFNKSGRIEDPPDRRFVKTSEEYFPGTIITAEILLNDDDLKKI